MKLSNTNIHNVKRNLTIEHISVNGLNMSFYDVARIVIIGHNGTNPILNLDFNRSLHKMYNKLSDDFVNYMNSHWDIITNLSNVHFIIINDEIKIIGIKDNNLLIIDTDN